MADDGKAPTNWGCLLILVLIPSLYAAFSLSGRPDAVLGFLGLLVVQFLWIAFIAPAFGGLSEILRDEEAPFLGKAFALALHGFPSLLIGGIMLWQLLDPAVRTR